MQREEFTEILKPVINTVKGSPWGAQLETELNSRFPADGEVVQTITAACHSAIEEGWMCKHGEAPLKYGRVIKPGDATAGMSVDVVDMTDIAGPHHSHPNGEVCLTMPVDSDATFDGAGAGWCVNMPGSAHSPTVKGGRALVLYLLPDGAIDFG
ncbi:MAG: DUF4863 family protein [Rhodospirillales bacterium]